LLGPAPLTSAPADALSNLVLPRTSTTGGIHLRPAPADVLKLCSARRSLSQTLALLRTRTSTSMPATRIQTLRCRRISTTSISVARRR
jgi:hypothetical protein